jgi:hypothetical protein
MTGHGMSARFAYFENSWRHARSSRCLSRPTVITQHASDRQEQVAPEIVRGFAAGILDPVVTCVISKWPVLEFAIAVLNDFRTNLSAEEIIQRLGLGRTAEVNDDRSIVFYGAGTDRFFDAVAETGQCQLFRANLSMTRGGDEHEADHDHQSTHFGTPTNNCCLRKHLATQPKTDLGRPIFRLHLDADALKEGGRQNSTGTHNDRIVLDPYLVSLLFDIDVITTDLRDARLKQDVQAA